MLDPGQTWLAELRVSAALPAAGAWDAAPIEITAAYAQFITLYLTYTRGDANGAFDFQVHYSPYSLAGLVPAGASEWVMMTAYDAGMIAAGVDTQSSAQREYITYTAVGAAAEALVFGPLDLRGTVERIRVRARESGVVGTPGTLQIEGLIR